MSFQTPANTSSQKNIGINFLKRDGVIVFPTDTVYCLACRYDNIKAVNRVYEIKQRAHNLALPIMVADKAQINKIVKYIPDSAQPFIAKYMPGPITLIMPKADSVNSLITDNKDTVAVRIPKHDLTLDLIKGVGVPLVATSANISGMPNNADAEQVIKQIGDKVDFVLDSGECPLGTVSTIVDVTGEIPVILREGAISRKELQIFYEGIK
ncbi:MAG: L-threonylcarbamoyladenylate synthase [Dehalococcoidales bacterium]